MEKKRGCDGQWSSFNQTLLKMKLTTFILLLSIMGAFASKSFSQTNRLTMTVQDVRMEDFLKLVENQSSYRFFYSGEIDVDQKVSVSFNDSPINEVLTQVLHNAGITYEIKGRQVILSSSNPAVQTGKIDVNGTIKDSSGQPLPGVTVLVKGTTQGTISDFDGNYTLKDVPADAILVFSFVGMRTEEMAVSGKSVLNITMVEDAIGIEEVVAVGYGTQKKVNLTGAVSNIDSEELVKRPINSVANMLQGKLSGVLINQGSGQPGKENTYIRIRGTGTFSGAGNNPLVIVDGVSGSLSNVDPENVESISVLKDAASSAIYGARAANGVIVVTTKNGKTGTLDITYHGNCALQSATILPDFISNSAEYMEMWNYAHERQGIPNLFDQSVIDAYKNASPGDAQYPNFDWMDYGFNTATVQKHSLSANGGTDKTHFYANLSYYDQPGVVIGHDFKKYSGQLNFDAKISKYITFGADVSLGVGDRKEPWLYDSDFILLIYGSQPMYSPYLADGSGRYSHGAWPEKWVNRNPAFVANEGGRYQESQNIRAISYLKVDILPELTWQIKGAIDYSHTFHKTHQYPVQTYSFATGEPYSNGWPTSVGVKDEYSYSKMPTFYSTLDYKKSFAENHNVSALVGYNQESFFARNLNGYRKDFNFSSLKELNAGGTEGQTTGGTAYEWAIQSFFGRIAYDYKGKYLFEANARYDGTSRIHEDGRWGLFPSFSGAWRISDESFMQDFGWMDNLKLRASWGQLGNQNIGNYPYQDVLSLTQYPAGETIDQGVVQTRLTDKTLEWETTTSTDIGLDMTLENGLFSMVFDWYKKNTEGILYEAQIPGSVGLGAPTINFASMENKGIELMIGHRNNIGELSYSVDLNYSKNNNEVTKVSSPSYGRTSIVEGMPINSYYMIEWDGIFQTQDEIDAAPEHPGNPQPGDLRFKDANGDGKINSDDRVFVDGAHPDFTYGANINLEWKNWDMSMFFQGVKGQKYYIDWWGFWPFTQGTPPTTDWRNAWTPENHSQTMPALWSFSTYGYTPMSATTSTYNLHDASYLRLKNLQIGYNLPKSLCSKIKMKEARVYFSADNLITWTNIKHVDPERLGTQWWSNRGSVYPQVKTLSLGVKVKF